MTTSKSCLSCGVVLAEASQLSVCPTCHRVTPDNATGDTLDGLIREIAPTAKYVSAHPTSDFAPPPLAQEIAGLSTWEQSLGVELAGRGYRIVRPFHDRMPAILHPGQFAAWLDGTLSPTDLKPLGPGEIVHHPVNRKLNSPKYEAPELPDPVLASLFD